MQAVSAKWVGSYAEKRGACKREMENSILLTSGRAQVLCGGHKPRGGVLRHIAKFPHLKRTAEGVLHDVFCQCEIVDSKDARQRGDYAPGFVPKQMIVGIYHMFIFMTGRISTAPSTSKIGQPLESSTA
jgi:hypothetical protein